MSAQSLVLFLLFAFPLSLSSDLITYIPAAKCLSVSLSFCWLSHFCVTVYPVCLAVWLSGCLAVCFQCSADSQYSSLGDAGRAGQGHIFSRRVSTLSIHISYNCSHAQYFAGHFELVQLSRVLCWRFVLFHHWQLDQNYS